MEPAQAPLTMQLISMINKQSSPHWRRIRLAVTQEELAEIKAWVKENDETRDVFWWSLRGVPLVVEENPTRYEIQTERY